MDLVAVERRDEGLVQERDRLVRQLVRGALGGVDALRVRIQVGEAAEHRGELLAPFDDARGVRVEEIEKLPLTGHQASEHSSSLVAETEAERGQLALRIGVEPPVLERLAAALAAFRRRATNLRRGAR